MNFWDSSAIVPLLVNESDSARRTESLMADTTLVVWWGSSIECESAIQRRFRDGSLNTAGARFARDQLSVLSSAWHELLPSAAIRTLAIRLLRTHPLRAADSLQLAAALFFAQESRSSVSLLTADSRLADAAEIEGLCVLR